MQPVTSDTREALKLSRVRPISGVSALARFTAMFASNAFSRGASSYRNLSLETSVAQADPHTLIDLLYRGALTAIAQARVGLARGDVAAKGEATGRALRIIEEGLKASLDARGGELAANLKALYEYMSSRLLQANLADDDTRYAEVAGMLGQLHEAWQGIAAEVAAMHGGAHTRPSQAIVAGRPGNRAVSTAASAASATTAVAA